MVATGYRSGGSLNDSRLPVFGQPTIRVYGTVERGRRADQGGNLSGCVGPQRHQASQL